MARVETIRIQRITNEQVRIRDLNLEASHHLLELCLEREPSLIFDLLAMSIPHPTSDPQQPGPSDPQQPAWCICTKCKEMPTDIERKCCGQLLDSCVSMLPHMDAYIMQGGGSAAGQEDLE
ncbi:unnamed protein product [Boreogadus saida]